MSQEYTPVDWVDETTSQQGTLINAARLTQMQTAHHYADGFEEVDAIPTQDPGVAYHKVVYCTADATFYRWDGEVWTADIDEDTKHLLDQEIARATQAEGELAQDIEDEATARASADTALGARIDEEAEFREAVDRQLTTQIGALNGETLPLYRSSSTPTIQNAVAANEGNISNLTSVVDGLAYDLGQEVSNREGADTQLAADITAEAQARAAAIASLQAGVYTKAQTDTLLAGKADVTALTDGSVTKLGTVDVGTDTKPIKLVGGVPTAVGHDLVTKSMGIEAWSATFTYDLNAFTNLNGTLYRSLAVDNLGHDPATSAAWWAEYSPGGGPTPGQLGPSNLYTADIGDGVSTSIAIAHGLDSMNVVWSMWDNTTGKIVSASAVKTSADVLTVTFSEAPSTGAYRILIYRPGDAGRIFSQTFAPASNDVVITHNLGRLPSGIGLYNPSGVRVGARMEATATTVTLHLAGYEAGNYTIQVIA